LNFDISNKLHQKFNFDEEMFTEAIEHILEKNNSNYINFQIKKGDIAVNFDLSELFDYKELYLSWYVNKSLLFNQFTYPDDTPYFYKTNNPINDPTNATILIDNDNIKSVKSNINDLENTPQKP
jgi:hypothetical protein